MLALFVRPKKKKIFSELIMWYLKILYSHTALQMEVEGIQVVFHTNYKGAHPQLLEDFLKEYDIIEAVDVSRHSKEKAFHFCMSKMLKKYSWISILAIVLRFRFSDGSSRMICSEHSARALGFKVDMVDLVTPRDFREML